MERKCIIIILTLLGGMLTFPRLLSSKTNVGNSSVFWEISGKDLKKRSYLFGTFHLLNENYLNKYKDWQKKFKESEAVIVEMIVDSSKMRDMVAKMVSPDTTLDKLLDETEYKMTNDYLMEVSGTNLNSFNSLKPISLSVLLSTYTWAKLKPEDYITNDLPMDLFFVKEGRDRAKTIIPLETMEEQLSLLYDGITLKRQKELLMDMVKDKEKTKKGILKMDSCYRNQDLEGLRELIYSSESYKNDELERLLKNRNQKWMEKITGSISSKSTFIAVGAGHLPGEDGLINLLIKEGYSVNPILF